MPVDESVETAFMVVMNEEEQYSIWPTFKTVPLGWKETGFIANREKCLDHIKQVWTDMRPLSLRKQLEEWNKQCKQENTSKSQPGSYIGTHESSLVTFLASRPHAITLDPVIKTAEMFEDSLNGNHVYLTFTDTQGCTSLGVNIDPAKTKFTNVNFKECMGQVHLEGDLIVDYYRICCIAEIDLCNLKGKANVSIIEKVSPHKLAEKGQG